MSRQDFRKALITWNGNNEDPWGGGTMFLPRHSLPGRFSTLLFSPLLFISLLSSSLPLSLSSSPSPKSPLSLVYIRRRFTLSEWANVKMGGDTFSPFPKPSEQADLSTPPIPYLFLRPKLPTPHIERKKKKLPNEKQTWRYVALREWRHGVYCSYPSKSDSEL